MSITHVTPREMELQAEVTRLEMELVHWKEARQSAIDAGELIKAERDELRAKLAALEAQKPATFGWQNSDGLIIDCISLETNAKCPGDYTIPLYLAAGAKEPNHG